MTSSDDTFAVPTPLISIVIPAYNEAARIAETLKLTRAYLDQQSWTWELIVSADGNDGTREIVRRLRDADPTWAGRLTVIGSSERGGKGKGIREGVKLSQGRYIGFIDADYKTPAEELDRLLPELQKGAHLVIGSRAVGDSRIIRPQPLYRRLGSKAFKWVMRAIVGLYGIGDTQCGFKFFQGHVAKDIFARQRIDGYMFDVEILRIARKSHYTIKEVGVRWQDDGDSRYDPISGTWRNAKELLRIRFMRYPKPAAAAPAKSATSAPISPVTPALSHT